MTHETTRANEAPKQERTDSSTDFTDGYEVEQTEPQRWADVQFSMGTIVFRNGHPSETMASDHYVEVVR